MKNSKTTHDNKKFVPDFKKAVDLNFYKRKTELVAKELLGKVIVRNFKGILLAGKIVETEAYLQLGDFASHSSVGKTERNAPMFEEGGILYVYKIYGTHHCINFVTETEYKGSAVLIRALEPLLGIEKMIAQRKTDKISNLCQGPGNLALALGFTKSDNNKSLLSHDLFVQKFENPKPDEIAQSARIGITKSANLQLRYFIKDSEFVSAIKNTKLSK